MTLSLELFLHLGVHSRGYRGRASNPCELQKQQDELFHVAQAVATEHFPSLQADLEDARGKVMALLKEHKARLTGDLLAPHKKYASLERWYDHQITPEVTRDPSVGGLIVPRELSQRLLRLHKEQIRALTDLLARRDRT